MAQGPSDHAVQPGDLKGHESENTFAGALSSLRCRYRTDPRGVEVAVTGVPFDTATTNRPGARFGPRGVRAASANLAWARPYGWDFDPRDGLIDVEHSLQVGLRTHNDDTLGIAVLDAPWVHARGVAAVVEQARARLAGRKVYLTFDIDCLDPAFAPGTGTPVVGGLTSGQALAVLKGLRGLDVVGADVVEVAPAYDSAEITALAAAHIGFEILALFACRPGGPMPGAWPGGSPWGGGTQE